MKRIVLFLFLLGLVGCGGVSLISRGTEDLYTKEFIAKIERAKGVFSQGNAEQALADLNLIKEDLLLPSERAMKRNLMGVIHFGKGEFEQAIFQFNTALTSSSLDQKLTAQIYLNLASSYFKLGDVDNTLSTLMLCDFKNLKGKEFQNYHKLRISVSKELGKKRIVTESLMWLMSEKKDLVSLKSAPEFSELVAQYFAMNQSERLRMVKDFGADNKLVSGYLTYLEVEQLHTLAKREDAEDLLEWIEDQYDDNQELMNLVVNFKSRLKNYSALNQFSIGVILPLSGKKAVFGRRALAGIDHAVRRYNSVNQNAEGFVPIQLHIADSEGSAIVGKNLVTDLIENKNVALIVGGLFSTEALAEYEVSKRLGTFFISLSQIYADKGIKDHLLVEIPGSVESQVSVLFSEDFLNTFGRNGAIIYPSSDRGIAYMDEFWRKANEKGVEVQNIYSYDRSSTDHRDTVKRLLGLKFTRERQEELEILKELHELEGATSIRRIQTLKPEIDFDWTFIPSFPSEALQLIPSFGYFDAFDIPLIGDPSWRSQIISKESFKLGRLYFVDSDVPKHESDFSNSYEARYGNKPRLIEILGYEAFEVANNILRNGQYESRAALEGSLRSLANLRGLTGSWRLDDNVWIKSMNTMSLYRGKTSKMRMKEVKAE
ncbi:ABC transporter substrate-binding protein [Bacteriovorax sp. DB6_IX]|uniref:ABC transporter substrate-binding protein n=1 Tax=Bacteriovorax sp. DB6_IX TaxID=1353530 RepID=UPI00041D0826|nr:ABC transporter substrate-binding protein [Bacteriovorax sp. DB6_IX]